LLVVEADPGLDVGRKSSAGSSLVAIGGTDFFTSISAFFCVWPSVLDDFSPKV